VRHILTVLKYLTQSLMNCQWKSAETHFVDHIYIYIYIYIYNLQSTLKERVIFVTVRISPAVTFGHRII